MLLEAKDLPLQPTCVVLVECASSVMVRKGEIVATAMGGMGKPFDGGMLNPHVSRRFKWKIGSWKTDDNSRRPHRSLGDLTPDEYARQRQAASLSVAKSMAADQP